MRMQLGDALREARKRRGLTQAQVGAALPHRVHSKTVGKWERGIAIPRGQLPDLERVLGLRLTNQQTDAPTSNSGPESMTDQELVAGVMRLMGEIARRLPAGTEPAEPIDAATVLERGWTVTRRSGDGQEGGERTATAQ